MKGKEERPRGDLFLFHVTIDIIICTWSPAAPSPWDRTCVLGKAAMVQVWVHSHLPSPFSHVLIKHPLWTRWGLWWKLQLPVTEGFLCKCNLGLSGEFGLAASVPMLSCLGSGHVCKSCCCRLFATPTVSFSGGFYVFCAFPVLKCPNSGSQALHWWASLSPAPLKRNPFRRADWVSWVSGPLGNFLWNSKWFLFLELISLCISPSLGKHLLSEQVAMRLTYVKYLEKCLTLSTQKMLAANNS